MTSTEVDYGLKDRVFQAQVGAVVDTILNRAASGRWGSKGDIRSVVNAPLQFSQISGNKGAYGSVQNMPNNHIKRRAEIAVLRHLEARMNGADSTVGGHLNYANPYSSSPTSMAWVRPLQIRAQREGLVFGEGRAIHVHGTDPGFARFKPKPFNIKLM